MPRWTSTSTASQPLDLLQQPHPPMQPRSLARERRAESGEPRAESREPRARAESREPRAESREPREFNSPNCYQWAITRQGPPEPSSHGTRPTNA